jgi:hypothetical protein
LHLLAAGVSINELVPSFGSFWLQRRTICFWLNTLFTSEISLGRDHTGGFRPFISADQGRYAQIHKWPFSFAAFSHPQKPIIDENRRRACHMSLIKAHFVLELMPVSVYSIRISLTVARLNISRFILSKSQIKRPFYSLSPVSQARRMSWKMSLPGRCEDHRYGG